MIIANDEFPFKVPSRDLMDRFRDRTHQIDLTPELKTHLKDVIQDYTSGKGGSQTSLFSDSHKSNTHYEFSLDSKGGVTLTSQFVGMWAGMNRPSVGKNELVPAGTKPEDALKMLQDKLGISPEVSQALYSQMQADLKAIQNPQIPDRFKIEAPTLRKLTTTEQPQPAEPTKTAEPTKAKPHVVLKSGDTVSGLYNSIPKDQRPPFEEFKKEFMTANPSVTDPNKVFAGKDYALPSKYNYDGLKQAGRLIEPNVAELAKHVASAGVSSSQIGSGDPSHGVTAGKASSGQTR